MPEEKTILIVDDDTAIASSLGALIGSWGFQVIYAEDGVGASLQLQKHRTDLVILDYRLPGGNGAAIYERLKISNKFRHLPIIFVSASALNEIEPRVRQIKDIRFLKKPIDQEQLKKTIEELLNPGAAAPPASPAAGTPPKPQESGPGKS